jgi:hypothetical protein
VARCAEHNYFLLRDPEYLKTNQESVAQAKQALEQIHDLGPGEQSATQQALENVTLYGNSFGMRCHRSPDVFLHSKYQFLGRALGLGARPFLSWEC